jgi:hypothetical protein
MPDITMCGTKECELRDACYRAQATPSQYWQAWCNFTPEEDGTCQFYYAMPYKTAEKNNDLPKL